ncbi:unnamed protein product [Rotaria sp. Silwood1]|nr:unnamed protein product [Rotaria sp. Silwood1]
MNSTLQSYSMTMSSTAIIINRISRWLNYLFAIPMIILGIIGAILTIIVFTRKRSFRCNPTIIYLLAGAIMTAIHLPTIYLQSILVDGFGLGIFNTNDIACREHNYLLYVTTVPTISFPCWAAFDQYASTYYEVNFRNHWSSIRIVRLAIFFTIIIYIPIILISNSINNVCILIDSPIKKFYNYFLTPIVYTIGPLILIIIFTLGTIRNLRFMNFVHRRTRLTKQIRRMLIPQLFVLVISGIPFGIQNIYDDLTSKIEKDILRLSIEHLFVQIIRLFYHCNFVCTFYIYFYMSSVVRKVLRELLFKHIRQNHILQTDMSLNNSITLKTLKSTKCTI